MQSSWQSRRLKWMAWVLLEDVDGGADEDRDDADIDYAEGLVDSLMDAEGRI